jgi:hypothetical protein
VRVWVCVGVCVCVGVIVGVPVYVCVRVCVCVVLHYLVVKLAREAQGEGARVGISDVTHSGKLAAVQRQHRRVHHLCFGRLPFITQARTPCRSRAR